MFVNLPLWDNRAFPGIGKAGIATLAGDARDTASIRMDLPFCPGEGAAAVLYVPHPSPPYT